MPIHFVIILPELEAAVSTNTNFHSFLREVYKNNTVFKNIQCLKVCFV
jgi:hypothetical protein